MPAEVKKDVKEEEVEPQTPQSKKEAPEPESKKEPPKEKKAEIPKNCAACNKPMKPKTRYYRNGAYYCSKKCWKKARMKAEEERARLKKEKKEEASKKEGEAGNAK